MATADNADLSDSLEEGSSDDEADNKGRRRRRRAQLRVSASVPLFQKAEREREVEEQEELGGSETELGRAGLAEAGLELAQSYAGKHQDTAGHGHKVRRFRGGRG